MHTFYAEQIHEKKILLDPSESTHAVRVLRLQTGDEVQVLNGRGDIYSGVISKADPRQAVISIIRLVHLEKRAPYSLHIALAPPKNMNRFEFFLEKVVETGIDEITPLLCEHSERDRIRRDRMEKVIVAAMKQSGQSFMPRLNVMTSFSEFVQQPFTGNKLIAHCCTHGRASQHLSDAITSDRIRLLIGPEGDFSRQELELALLHKYLPVSLGPSRLRTETAGMAAAVITATRFFRVTE
ncbi:MAG: 16S rRNA (uracil(1498)-N(3))-methyltransferase [Bacteroidales bacterium]|nr:16S rRNA (uracil(1498)-N(3))-methyltransferase [Bacteroidales bacterium]